MNNNFILPGVAIAIAIIIIAALGIVAMYPYAESIDSGKLKIMASFYPFYEITRNIADDAEVSSFVPIGSEPHTFDPTPGDIIRLNDADVFITSGIGLEEWELTVLEGLEQDILVIDASDGITLLPATDSHDHEHSHSDYDPHYWISPGNAIIIAQNIRDSLKILDPANSELYEQNTELFIQQLEDLDAEFTEGLESCTKSEIITTHAAFAYLGNDYGFSQIAILGVSPESEPTPGQIIGLIEEAREHDLKYIFFEELVDPRISETIAQEIGAQTLVLNPVAGITKPNQDNSYIGIMQRNLENLKVALECGS